MTMATAIKAPIPRKIQSFSANSIGSRIEDVIGWAGVSIGRKFLPRERYHRLVTAAWAAAWRRKSMAV
jgi:hypothetical protein